MPHEVAHVQRVPQILVCFKGQGVQGQQGQGFALASLYLGVGVGGMPPQRSQGGAVQIFKQLALPGIPNLRAGAANVSHGQQVERCEVAFVAHSARKGLDDIRIAQVLFLSDVAHGEVLAHQEFNQQGVVSRHMVVLAKATHLDPTEVGMVAAAALGNVMEQGGYVQYPGLVPAGGELRAKGVLVGVFRQKKPAHIAQHHQDVLVHGVDMEQVVLHLTDDSTKGPQGTSQHRGLIHQPHGMRDPFRLLKNAQELQPIDGVAPKRRVHQRTCVVEGSQGSG